MVATGKSEGRRKLNVGFKKSERRGLQAIQHLQSPQAREHPRSNSFTQPRHEAILVSDSLYWLCYRGWGQKGKADGHLYTLVQDNTSNHKRSYNLDIKTSMVNL